MPDAGVPLTNDLPTSDASQSAPVEGVIPVNVCSVVVAVDGSASNTCEPTHVSSTTGEGSAPVFAPVSACAVTAALDGTADGTCTGTGSAFTGTGSPGDPGTGATLPVTLCGVQAALGGSASASCPQPTAAPSATATVAAGTPSAAAASRGTPAPAALVADSGPVNASTGATGSSGASSLASTGAPLLLELLLGAGALLMGVAIKRSARRGTNGKAIR